MGRESGMGREPGLTVSKRRSHRRLARAPRLIIRAAHPRPAILTALGVTLAAALTGRPGDQLLLVMATVLTGQACLGWFNDLIDRGRDARHARTDKPLVAGEDGAPLDPDTVWFCLALAILLVVPLSMTHGVLAGSAYLLSLAIAAAGHWAPVRRGVLSWLPWAASYALLPAFLSYGAGGPGAAGAPPDAVVTALAALLGIGVHFLTALWGLVADHEDRWTYLPLRLSRRIGAETLLRGTGVYLIGVVIALLVLA